jgi:hypothetical protein
VHEAVAGDSLQRLEQDGLEAEPVDVAHREDEKVEHCEQPTLRIVDRPRPDESNAARIQGRQRIGLAVELATGQAERHGQRHTVDVSRRRGLRSVQISVGIEPEHAASARSGRETP